MAPGRDTHVEGLLRAVAATEAGLVATAHKDIPVLGLRAGGQDGLPVVHGHRGDALLGDLLGQLLHRRGGLSGWHIILEAVEPALHAIGEGHLLLSQGQSREEGDK